MSVFQPGDLVRVRPGKFRRWITGAGVVEAVRPWSGGVSVTVRFPRRGLLSFAESDLVVVRKAPE